MTHHILVFTKAPQPGRVKTRLQPEIRPADSVRLHKLMLQGTLQSCAAISAETSLWVSPDSHSRYLRRLAQRYGFGIRRQQGNDLGQRMRQAINVSRPDTGGFTLLIGSDCPSITPTYLASALDALRHDPVVIGPATDGGYVLIGARRSLPRQCFDNIEWGSNKVLEQTLQRMQQSGMSYNLLPVQQDIDRPEDLACVDNDELHRMRWLFGIE